MIGFSTAGEFITMPLTSTTLLPKSSNIEESTVADANDLQLRNQEFANRVRNILRSESGSSRPMLKLDSNVSHASEAYAEILSQEIDDLRADYFSRYQTATKEIERRSQEVLEKLKRQQPRDKEARKRLTEKLRAYNSKVQTLSTRVEELNKKQEYQENKIKEDHSDQTRDSPFISEEQQKVITNALQRMGEKIKELKSSHLSMQKSVDNLLEKEVK